MNTSADKILNEEEWETIEFLFKPRNQGELLLRLNFEGTKNLVYDAFKGDAPNALPFRFRYQHWPAWEQAIWKEEFYIKLKSAYEK